MQEEVWKDIPGYEGLYQASNIGNIRSLDYCHTKRTKNLKPVLNKGYYRVSLSKNKTSKNYHVHRLVWESFNGPIPEGMQVNHINENKTDNRLENLNLMTSKENNNWGTKPERLSEKLTNRKDQSRPVFQFSLRGEFIAFYESQKEAERQTGISTRRISEVCQGKRKSRYGFIWRYVKKEAV